MLEMAERKRAAESRETNERARFVRGDMTDFALGETFALALIPFRAFQALLTPEDQRRALGCIASHLRPRGRLIIDVFDPRLDLILPDEASPRLEVPGARHPVTGNAVSVEVLSRVNDPVTQTFRERWRFTEATASGEVLRQEDELLELRWTYRYEMRHLLELSGYVVDGELSDFFGAAPVYGREQIWVARRR
jgi:SAM-dependent methyltransferase